MLELLRAVLARRLDPAARLLLGQMVMYTGIAAVFPVAPLYVRQHGGGSVAVALFIAGPMVANMLIQVPAGHLADRIGRKPVLIVSRLLYVGLSLGLFLNLGPLWLLACFRCGQGFTSGAYVPALQAALADITPDGRRGERYAQLQAVEMVGLLVGPAIGGVIALWTYSAIFLCSGLASLIGVTALFRLPETRSTSTETREARRPSGWWRTRAVIVPSLGLLAAGTLFAMYDTVWPQYLAARHVGTVLIGVSVSAFALPVLLLATTAGRLSDRTNRRLL
ncbi:MAG TPA: MFS transporter, partial [Chloroflexota bacterium]|nr:MFS transporter [Chloroflexota bacterium]